MLSHCHNISYKSITFHYTFSQSRFVNFVALPRRDARAKTRITISRPAVLCATFPELQREVNTESSQRPTEPSAKMDCTLEHTRASKFREMQMQSTRHCVLPYLNRTIRVFRHRATRQFVYYFAPSRCDGQIVFTLTNNNAFDFKYTSRDNRPRSKSRCETPKPLICLSSLRTDLTHG